MAKAIRFARLEDWLEWQQSVHPHAIEFGLDRVARVLARTGWRAPAQPVITVGGTNGKGSCVALLDAMLRAAGHRVGTFTSPHLVDYRERIRLDGAWVADAALVAAFERIADALGGDSLTFFEFNALAALLVFVAAAPDVLVLEVGMGGRLAHRGERGTVFDRVSASASCGRLTIGRKTRSGLLPLTGGSHRQRVRSQSQQGFDQSAYERIYEEERRATLKEVTRKPIMPSEEETKNNPRARSAKLRIAEKM